MSQKYWPYRLVHKYFVQVKAFFYALVVLLNLNVLMSPPSLSRPFYALFNTSYRRELSYHEAFSLFIIFALGIANLLGYSVVM